MTECQIEDENGIAHRTCSVDEILRLLVDSRRRTIISVLETTEENWIPLAELVSECSSRESTAVDWHLELHHVHLPLLDDLGLADYDRHDEMIRYYQCELVSEILDIVDPEFKAQR